MSVWFEPKAGQLALVNAKVALAAYVGAKMHLFSNDITPNANSVLADFTEVVFTGYAAKVVTWSAAFYDQNGIAVSSGGALLFVQSAVTASDNAYGAFLTDAAGTGFLGAARLDSPPFPFNAADKALELAIQLASDGGVLIQVAGP